MLLIKLIIAASENHHDIMDLKWLFQDNLGCLCICSGVTNDGRHSWDKVGSMHFSPRC